MSALKGYRKEIGAGAAVVIFGIAILAAVSSYYFPSAGTTQSTVTCSSSNINQPVPTDLFKDAPIPGYTYLITYNTTNGAILGGGTQLSCQLGGKLPPGPFAPSGIGLGQVATIEQNAAWLNVTADPNLRPMVANGYSDVFYVSLQTHLLVLKPGVTFNSNYSQAYYNGQPITNGTSLPNPSQ